MGKVALITGGSSGLGLALAEKLGRDGFSVILLARDRARLDRAVARLEVLGVRAQGHACDITDEAGLQRVFEAVKAEHVALDFLILNAGSVTPKVFADYGEAAALRRELDVNLWGTILPTHTFLPLVPGGGRILMVSSGFGLMGAAGYTMYCAAKAGVIKFAGALRRELLTRDIHVYAACPGDIDTPMFHEELKQAPAWMKKESPRKLLTAEVVAARILKRARGKRNFLIIPASDVAMLMVLKRLPRVWLDGLLDRMFPTP